MNIDITDALNKSVHIHLVSEMGGGKSTLNRLLQVYDSWLWGKAARSHRFIHANTEKIPEHLWEEYQRVFVTNTPNASVYQVQ